jgi:hypothetical protein
MFRQTHHANRGRAVVPEATHLLTKQLIGSRRFEQATVPGRRRIEGKTDVLITASGQTASEVPERVDTVKSAILPAAIFIVVEVVLVAETISVILLQDMHSRNVGAVAIAILLSVALLANLGLVCSMAAAIAAQSVRRSNRARARAFSSSFPAASAPVAGVDSAERDVAGADLPAPDVAPRMPASG